VEDDRLLGESLKEYLESEGFLVDWIYDSREFFDLLEVSIYDAIVLDLMMPHISGEELLRELREKGNTTPVLILTAKGRIEDKEKYVWGDEPVGDEVVRAHIKNLRRLLPEGFIVSQKGRGYRVEA